MCSFSRATCLSLQDTTQITRKMAISEWTQAALYRLLKLDQSYLELFAVH